MTLAIGIFIGVLGGYCLAKWFEIRRKADKDLVNHDPSPANDQDSIDRRKELDDIRVQFVSNLSHEIRTPINCVQESVHLLLDKVVGTISDEQKHVLEMASRNVKRLTNLVNELLDLTLMEAGEMTLNPVNFQITEWIQEAEKSFATLDNSKKIKMSCIVPEGKVLLHADKKRLVQVLNRLVGSTMKSVPENGFIRVEFHIKRPGGGSKDELLEVGIFDNGAAYSEQQRAEVFHKFLHGRAEDKESRAGLGLSIPKQIIELHGGRIWAESGVNGGRRFAFSIPHQVI